MRKNENSSDVMGFRKEKSEFRKEILFFFQINLKNIDYSDKLDSATPKKKNIGVEFSQIKKKFKKKNT